MDTSTLIIILLLLAVACGIALLFIYKKGKYRETALRILLGLVAQAEIQFGAKTGLIKNSYVFRSIYEAMPALFKLLFSQDQVLALIEEALSEFKQYLERNTAAAASLEVKNE